MVAACRGRGGSTYRGGSTELRAAKGDGRVFLSGWPPVGQQRQEEFREGATVVVWLRGDGWRDKEDGRRKEDAKQGNTEKKYNSSPRDTLEESGNGNRGDFPLGFSLTQVWIRVFTQSCGTHPAGPAPLALGEQQRGALEDRPGGSPVLPATHQSRKQGQRDARREPLLWVPATEACLGNPKILQCGFSRTPTLEITTKQPRKVELVYFQALT